MTIGTGPSRRYLISKNLILLLVMAVLIILAILAWFSFTKTVSANNIVVKAVSSEIDIAESIKTFKIQNDKLQVETDGPSEFGSEVAFNGPYKLSKDCTGDGYNLIVPEFNVARGFADVKQTGKEVNTNLSSHNATSSLSSALAQLQKDNRSQLLVDKGKVTNDDVITFAGEEIPEYQYIEEDFYVRSKNPELMLSSDSRIVSQTESQGNSLATYTNDKKSAYGDFNVDGLVGAIRVALIGRGTSSVSQTWSGSGQTATITSTSASFANPVKQLLWLPRPDVYLNVSGGSAIDNWTLSTGVDSDTMNGTEAIGAKSYKHEYYKKTNDNSGVVLTNSVDENDGEYAVSSGTYTQGNISYKCLGASKNISNFGDNYSRSTSNLFENYKIDSTTKHDYYVTKYTLKIWIEGTDAEARRAMDRGTFNLILEFM